MATTGNVHVEGLMKIYDKLGDLDKERQSGADVTSQVKEWCNGIKDHLKNLCQIFETIKSTMIGEVQQLEELGK